MRTVLIATAAAVVMAAAPAAAQNHRHDGGLNGGHRNMWTDGRWRDGSRAPGWAEYRRPDRGWRMPGYWRSPDWNIVDWRRYGLRPPPRDYGWSRYYDDAVLSDEGGYVYDSVAGIDWEGARGSYYDAPGGYAYAEAGRGGYGYGRDGYGPVATATAIVEFGPPVTTTTTTTTVEWVHPRQTVRKWRPKSKLLRRTK